MTRRISKISNIEHFTKTGTFHLSKGKENQDSFLYSDSKRYEIISLADGVSSCENGAEGSAVACETVNKIFTECGELFFNSSCEKVRYLITSEIQNRLNALSEKTGKAYESFASTLSFACLQKETGKLMTFQLGDSNVYLFTDDGCFNTAQAGELQASFTVCEDADERAKAAMYDSDKLRGVLLCSDGAWKEFCEDGNFHDALSEALTKSDFAKLGTYLENRGCRDDCSYILMEFDR